MSAKDLPEWVLKHKEKGTEIRNFNEKYYLYKIRSIRDPNLGRPKKITEKYLGRISPEGLIKPKHDRLLDSLKAVTVREFWATKYLLDSSADIIELLKRIYADCWKEVFLFSVFRLMYNSPIKNLYSHYATSYISETETLNDASLSPKAIGELLRRIGSEREKITQFLKPFVQGSEFMIIDGTHILSSSDGVDNAMPGYNSKGIFDPQIRLILIHSIDKHTPAYFRYVCGSFTDVSVVKLTVKESGAKNAVLIGDKGTYSEDNIEELEGDHLKYILPMKRDNTLINYENIESGNRQKLNGCFLFQNRHIWYDEQDVGERRVIIYLDQALKTDEERCFVLHVKDKKKKMKELYEKQYHMGTIAVITNYKRGDAEKIYSLLKGRLEIEQVLDTFKNTLKADKTYMRNDYQMEGWLFINFISLLLYYKIYALLMQKKMLHKYSPKDVLMHFSRIHKIKIGDAWMTAEIPKKSQTLMDKLGVSIT